MTDMRKCDVCGAVLSHAAAWWFITHGRTKPSDWAFAKHWCSECMTLALAHLQSLAA